MRTAQATAPETCGECLPTCHRTCPLVMKAQGTHWGQDFLLGTILLFLLVPSHTHQTYPSRGWPWPGSTKNVKPLNFGLAFGRPLLEGKARELREARARVRATQTPTTAPPCFRAGAPHPAGLLAFLFTAPGALTPRAPSVAGETQGRPPRGKQNKRAQRRTKPKWEPQKQNHKRTTRPPQEGDKEKVPQEQQAPEVRARRAAAPECACCTHGGPARGLKDPKMF